MSRETDIQTAETAALKPLELIRRTGESATPNVFALWDTSDALAGSAGDYDSMVQSATDAARGLYASLLSPGLIASIIYPYLLHYALEKLWPELNDVGSLMGRRYQRYHDATLTLQSRELTVGVMTAGGSNVGTGTGEVLSEDENGYPIEATALETKTFECLVDYNLGARLGEESFEARGEPITRHRWLPTGKGSGMLTPSRSISAADSVPFLQNPSFSQYSPSPYVAPLTALNGWDVAGALTNLGIVTGAGAYFRDMDGDSAQASVRFLASDTISQTFGTNATKLSQLTPYHLSIAVMRKASATGNIILTLGASSVTTALSSLTNDVWTIIKLPLTKARFAKQFNATGLKVSIQVATLAVGTVYVDDVVFCPMQKLDGLWYAIRGGATAFLKGDVFTQATTQADRTKGIKQWFFYIGTNHYLPSKTGTPTDVDPTF